MRSSPSALIKSVSPPTSSALIGTRDTSGIAAQKIGDLLFSLFGFDGADAIDDRAAAFDQVKSLIQHSRLQRNESGDIAGFLDPGNIRVTPDRAGAGAWCIEQNGIEGGAAERGHIGDDNFSLKPQALKIRRQELQPFGGAIDPR